MTSNVRWRFGFACVSAGLLILGSGCDSESEKDDTAWSAGAGATAGTGDGSTAGTGGDSSPTAGTTGDTVTAGADAPDGSPGGGAAGSSAEEGTWCDALAVFRTSCQNCHGTELRFGAPMPLVTYEDTQAMSLDGATPVWQAVGSRVHDANMPMPPVNQEPLTQAQLDAIDAWVAAGAPSAADPTCGGQSTTDPGEEEFEWPEDCEERYELRANDNGEPHIVRGNTETHPQFTFDVPWGGSGEVQALAMRPITDNERVLHHWILYQGNSFLTGWAPGKNPEVAPEDVGIYMPTSGTLRLDIHYYNMGNPEDEPDESGVEICITRNPRPYTAATYPFTGIADAPANQTVANTNTCTVEASEPIHLITSSPHMHKLGTHAKLEVIRTDGTVDVVHDSAFSFEDQVTTEIDVVLNDGDQVRVTCEYANTTSQDVGFGTSSDDEMCFNFMRYYPMCEMTCSGGDTFASIIAASQGGGCPSGGGGSGPGGFFGGS